MRTQPPAPAGISKFSTDFQPILSRAVQVAANEEKRILPADDPPGAAAILPLAARRAKKGITLEQIAESTKISVRVLQAIEEGEFHLLPGGLYSTSYIRQYARLADVNEGELLESYFRKTGTVSDPSTLSTKPRVPEGGSRPISRLFRAASPTTGSSGTRSAH